MLFTNFSFSILLFRWVYVFLVETIIFCNVNIYIYSKEMTLTYWSCCIKKLSRLLSDKNVITSWYLHVSDLLMYLCNVFWNLVLSRGYECKYFHLLYLLRLSCLLCSITIYMSVVEMCFWQEFGALKKKHEKNVWNYTQL